MRQFLYISKIYNLLKTSMYICIYIYIYLYHMRTHTYARARMFAILEDTNLHIIVKYILAIDFNLNLNIM